MFLRRLFAGQRLPPRSYTVQVTFLPQPYQLEFSAWFIRLTNVAHAHCSKAMENVSKGSARASLNYVCDQRSKNARSTSGKFKSPTYQTVNKR